MNDDNATPTAFSGPRTASWTASGPRHLAVPNWETARSQRALLFEPAPRARRGDGMRAGDLRTGR